MDYNVKISKISCFTATLLAIAVVEMSTDIYVPSLTSIADYFKTPITMVNLTISLNLVGLGVSGLLYGPLSDYRGRKFALALGGDYFSNR